MKLLLVAATEAEIGPTLAFLRSKGGQGFNYSLDGLEVSVRITGVGLMAATHAITLAVTQGKYDLVLQAGVAGSFDSELPLGEVVWITSEALGDQGAEDNGAYLDTFELGLQEHDAHPYSKGELHAQREAVAHWIKLPQVKGLTVNTVSGHAPTIALRQQKFRCQVESMEGAALHYVCLRQQVPFAEVRSISNYVTPRDRSSWQMGLAIKNLNDWLQGFITEMQALR